MNSPFDRAIAAFVSDIAKGTQSVQSRTTGYDVDQLIASITASAASGQAIDIPWRG